MVKFILSIVKTYGINVILDILFDLADYLVSKTKNKWDDDVIALLKDICDKLDMIKKRINK